MRVSLHVVAKLFIFSRMFKRDHQNKVLPNIVAVMHSKHCDEKCYVESIYFFFLKCIFFPSNVQFAQQCQPFS